MYYRLKILFAKLLKIHQKTVPLMYQSVALVGHLLQLVAVVGHRQVD